MILINRSFEIVTDESAAHGEAAESGLLASNESVGFRELVSLLQDGEPSDWPALGDTGSWVTHDQGETRAYFELGERESRSIHYSRDNPPHNARYWRLAFIAAGLVRGTS